MAKKAKDYYVYLFTRSRKYKDSIKYDSRKGVHRFAQTKLRARASAKGRELSVTFPILVPTTFSDIYDSKGRLQDGHKAWSFEEQYIDKCIKAAYKATCMVVEYMLSIHEDYWMYAPAASFADFVESAYYRICSGIPESWVEERLRIDKDREERGSLPFAVEELADWRYVAGVGPKPPSTFDKNYWDKYFVEYEEFVKAREAQKKA